MRNKKFRLKVLTAAVFLLLAGGAAAGILHTLRQQSIRNITAGNSVNMGSGYRNIVCDGKEYQYNTLVRTILLAGIDSEGAIGEGSYTDAPRADSIYLAVLNAENGQLTILAFDRDTMAEMHRYTVNGKDRGTYTSHICLAYTYGDGGKVSCENLRDAVSDVLGGIPVQEYLVMNRTSLARAGELVGDVSLVVPNGDLEALYPDYYEGAQVQVGGEMLEPFLRYRDTDTAFSNAGRMERQQVYIRGFLEKFQGRLKKDPKKLWEEFAGVEDAFQTSITRNKYLSMAKLLKQTDFTQDCIWTIPGERMEGELHDEFYVDEEAVKEKVLELFYKEV